METHAILFGWCGFLFCKNVSKQLVSLKEIDEKIFFSCISIFCNFEVKLNHYAIQALVPNGKDIASFYGRDNSVRYYFGGNSHTFKYLDHIFTAHNWLRIHSVSYKKYRQTMAFRIYVEPIPVCKRIQFGIAAQRNPET